MGVMNCSNINCNNILCDIYVHDIGYVCYECKNKFKEYILKENIFVTTNDEIKDKLKEFMHLDNVKSENIIDTSNIDKFFNKYNN